MKVFASVREDRIAEIAAALDLPGWLAKALIVEYLPCRRFFEEDAVVLFDFGLVKADDVRALPRPATFLSHITLFHNVTQSVISLRLVGGLVGLPMAAVGDPALILPEGKVNPRCAPWTPNPITASDWKLHPSPRAVVVETDGRYQWTVATFVDQPKPGTRHGWFMSAVYDADDLTHLQAIHDEIADDLFCPPHPTEPNALAASRARLEALYEELEQVRARMRAAVLAYHEGAKGRPEAVYGYTEDPPLTTTVFDELGIVGGKLKVRSHVEPLLFRAAYRAAGRAERARAAAVGNNGSAQHLAEEIEAAVEAITLSAMCLEAYINSLIVDRLPEFWKEMERTEARSKWLLVPALLGKRDCFDKGTMPFQAFARLVGWRNELVHYKHELANPLEVVGLGRVSELHGVCNAENARTAVEAATLMVRRINDCLGTPDPAWEANRGGWLNPL
jgi:hypothetical protein